MNKKTIFIYTGIAVGALSGNILGQWLMKPSQEKIANMIAAQNQKLPMEVDELTTLKSLSLKDNIFTYHYQLKVLSSEFPDFKAKMQSQLDKNICENGSTKQLNHEYAVSFEYIDKANVPMDSFKYDKGFCP